MITFRRANLILLFLPCLLATMACANGINPQRPSGATTIVASCTDRKSGDTIIVQRARMTADESTGWLEVRLEKSGAQRLELSKISRIQITLDESGSDGFAKASIELLEPSYKGDAFVRLKVNGNPVRLTGFSNGQERVDIPIAKCRELAFKAPTPSSFSPIDGQKK